MKAWCELKTLNNRGEQGSGRVVYPTLPAGINQSATPFTIRVSRQEQTTLQHTMCIFNQLGASVGM